MPDKTYSEEVFVLILVGIIVFLVITGLLVVIGFYYQKKKFQHKQQLASQEKEYAQQLLQSQLEIQEQTFNSISSEIHDNVGQILSLAKVQLNILDQKTVVDKGLLRDAKESVGKALTDLRDIAKSLSSDRILQSGLFEVTQSELQRIHRTGIMCTSIEQKGTEINISNQKKLIIFRIIQESLQNIIKHSNADNINIVFTYDKEQIAITITDDGKGFDTCMLEKKDGQGLQNIPTRANLIGGSAKIVSQPGFGTAIVITSPYE
jgi:signal transduction histidine kinase